MVPWVHDIPRGESMQFVSYGPFRSQNHPMALHKSTVEGQELIPSTSIALGKDERRLLGWKVEVTEKLIHLLTDLSCR